MILVRAPLRISFIGGGTDLPGFYRKYPGRVISTTIDKFVYLVIKPTKLVNRFIVKYQKTEVAKHPSELQHSRIRAALLHMNITDEGVEIGSFADIPAKSGLGSSSSFSVALMKGLNTYVGKKISKYEAANAAANLEIDLLKEPIGKQDQFIASFGGFNTLQFNSDESVDVTPVYLDYKKRAALEDHLLVFFTGITRDASSVLANQSALVPEKFEIYKKMSDSVMDFKKVLLAGDIRAMALMLHEGWERKKQLSANVSSSVIDALYSEGVKAGAWGGKIAGAGGGGCLVFLTHPSEKDSVRRALKKRAEEFGLGDFQEIPTRFTQSGTDILFNSHNALVS
ncbi:MAG: hypothetical protein A3F26_01965 [Candidatus Ryanbacteria bacterium RIFCSPHIGHO2_12_FULL_47_12b]|uniref:GHMP kinase n=2 Tax=Candidatus Ryaniibacteriota TaxID=1817914 RepID=A0A1G2H5H5_9BACT|nr:MAG: GHMP kinase [Parcubacteria group bacterium GW2011_GWA2_47_10b]KKU86374.1 MAG: GHMP kinase [Parcubacteria group bacterium GW2011_GWA1_47_9]OGZ47285.1 MAG: hypothetical protein A2844_02560 [Candidatus Ryanbacteria bacterium RIFCSPHIGHO2_01_FULL_48_80]OGZ49371.1 MAG: hypothetical protein A3C83_00750 [Candidatus Ryanbacteria bacterium RIFCSPHIGHO2_02_FULL_47_25]OGZ52472.1 MAG: hypothetical protein A3A29_01770 [Candidatus Ryanbacteria bacterium RIFCSPLOWO2_01_FULL_47_79]OGZ53258.1 MAG: hypo